MKAIFILIVMTAVTAFADSANPTTTADAARTAYDEGRFADAVALYDSLLAAYPRSPEIHFNRGNALARLGRIGEAAAAYERALLLAPRDADARANVKFLRSGAGLPQPRESLVERIVGVVSASEWRALAISAWWIGAALLVVGLLVTRAPRAVRAIGLVLIVVALIAAAGWGYWITRNARPIAFVVEPGVKALFAPIPSATPHFDAPDGLAVRVLETSGEWVHVRDAAREGWIPRRAVEIVRLD